MRHHKFEEVKTLVSHNQPVLLTGEKGSGKTTLAMQVAEDLDLDFHSISMTRQTTLSHLLGFISVNGTYIPSQLRNVAENGGVFLLDELDAGDANVLLCLNTIENGYISFPDGVVQLHEDFRLVATSNPQDKHKDYTGRSKLDAATLDRFDEIDIDQDDDLEKSLVDPDVFIQIDTLRKVMAEINSSKVISMRDSMRYQKRKDLGLLDKFIYKLTNKNDLAFEKFNERISSMPKHTKQEDCETLDDLIDLLQLNSKRPTEANASDGDIPF
jgi:MoxR-like ATPase